MEPLSFQSVPKESYGIQGYTVAKTCNYFKRDYKFPKSKRCDPISDAKKRSISPGPDVHNLSYEQNFKQQWKKSSGKFLKSKKLTLIEEIRKSSAKTPGPCDYSPNHPSISRKKPKKSVPTIGYFL
jgi:hypothetical protein